MPTPLQRAVEDVLQLRRLSDRLFRRTLEQVSATRDSELLPELLKNMFASATSLDIRAIQTLNIGDDFGLILPSLFSFRAKVAEMHSRHSVGQKIASWYLDDIDIAFQFADALEIPHTQRTSGPSSWNNLSLEPGTIVKPLDGSASRACYIIHALDNIVHVRDGMQINSIDDLKIHANKQISSMKSGKPAESWLSEQLVYIDPDKKELAPDLKFFAFYGQICLIKKIRRDRGKISSAYWDNKGNEVAPMTVNEEYLRGALPPNESLIKMVSRISSNIPFPFVRIDFLEGRDSSYLLEFTPRPGTFSRHTPEWDRELGRAWADAESRLQEDLLTGKDFSVFLKTTNLLGSDKPPSPM